MTAAGAGVAVAGAGVIGCGANEAAGVCTTAAYDEGANPSDGDGIGVGAGGGATGAAAIGGGGNVGTTMPGGGAATAKGSSINSTGRSGSCSWKGEAAVPLGIAAAAGGVVASEFGAPRIGAGVRGAPAVAGEAAVVDAVAFDVAECEEEAEAEDELTGAAGACARCVVAGPGDADAIGADVRDAVTVLDASSAEDAGAGDELLAAGVGAAFFGCGTLVAALLLVGMPTGFDTPANVAPARRLAAALAAAAIFRAVAVAAGLIGVGVGVGAAGADPGAAVLAADAPDGGAFASGRPSVPAPFVPSIRVGPPTSETPNNTSGSSSSPAAEASSGGIREVSGSPSGDGASTVGPADRSSKSPCESKSSPESKEGLFGDIDAGADEGIDGTDPMGSSTGRSAKGSSLGREAASIVFEPESGRSIQELSCNALADLPRRWLTDQDDRNPQCDGRHTLRCVPIRLTLQNPPQPESLRAHVCIRAAHTTGAPHVFDSQSRCRHPRSRPRHGRPRSQRRHRHHDL